MYNIGTKSKHILITFFILFFLFSIPQITQAQWAVFDAPVIGTTAAGAVSGGTTAVVTTWDKVKNNVIDPVARGILKMIIKKLTAATVNWINNGFNGNPGFISDPGQFFLDTADTAASIALSNANLSSLCTPFQASVRLALVKNYLQDNNNYSCTLSKIKDNYDAFTQDFSQGGWDGWFEMTQTSSGNPYSSYFAAQNSLSVQVSSQINRYATQIAQDSGFLSFEKCKPAKVTPDNLQVGVIPAGGIPGGQALPAGANATPNGLNPDGTIPSNTTTQTQTTAPTAPKGNMKGGELTGKIGTIDTTNCPNGTEVVTPGSVIETQLEGALGTDLKQLELARSVDEIASALLTQLFNRVMSDTGLKQDNTPNSGAGYMSDVEIPSLDKPFITLLARSPLKIQRSKDQDGNIVPAPFTDPGAIAYDYEEGDISDKITSTGTVDTKTVGTYTITYNAKNTKGVEADPVTLTVIVEEGPEIPGGGSVTCKTNPDTGEMTCTMGKSTPSGEECAMPQTDEQKTESQKELDWILPKLNEIPVTEPITGAPPANYQSAVQDILNQAMELFPEQGGQYYPGENTIGFGWTYVVGPSTVKVSNLIEPGDTWRSTFRVTCDNTSPETPNNPNTPETPTTPSTPNANGSPKIDSILPMTAKPGSSITIKGSNLTNQVSFFDGAGQRQTVVGTVNTARTQTTVIIPNEQAIGNATVKIYQGNQIWSKGILIKIDNSGTTPGTTGPAGVDATTGYAGSLAYNPTLNNWLIVSSRSGGVNGRIIKNDQTPVTSEFKIDDGTRTDGEAKVAFAPNLNKYLVIWVSWDTNPDKIYGRFVNPDGTFPGERFIIFSDPPGGAAYFYQNSVMKYDSINKKFVFVWQDRNNGDNASIITVNQSGVPGTVIRATQNTSLWLSGAPSIALRQKIGVNEYCVMYDRRNTSGAGIRKINMTTGIVGPETSVTNALGVTDSNIVYNSVNDKYLAVWTEENNTVKGKILNSCDGNNGGQPFTIITATWMPVVSYNSKSNTYGVVGHADGLTNNYAILNSAGTVTKTGSIFTQTDGAFGQFWPSISANTTDGSFAATTAKNYAITRFVSGLK